MKAEQDKGKPVVMNLGGPSRFSLSNPSAKIVLALLFLVSLNVVACYDTTLSVVLRMTRSAKLFAIQIALVSLSLAREIFDAVGRRLH
jgi:hypothetical protein